MDNAMVHPRVMERHPELAEQDVLDAWNSCFRAVPRIGGDAIDYIAVGVDSKGRLVEMVARQAAHDTWIIFHAFTPPTRKALHELGLGGR